MKLLYITSLFLALFVAHTRAEVCKGTTNVCDSLGFHKRKIKKTVFCLKCDEYSERKKEITCDDKVYTHSGLLKDNNITICVPPTDAPTGTPTMTPTLAPSSTPYSKQFTAACNAATNCNAPRWHPKMKKITTRGTPICAKVKRGNACKVSKKGRNIAKKLK